MQVHAEWARSQLCNSASNMEYDDDKQNSTSLIVVFCFVLFLKIWCNLDIFIFIQMKNNPAELLGPIGLYLFCLIPISGLGRLSS